mmetsp:Transcript_23729/g.66276  ORF Transcript_23729/g.66276 Transcript_23729/m.66276 type:complete len:81 (+) Transcript_23729:104-346(+)
MEQNRIIEWSRSYNSFEQAEHSNTNTNANQPKNSRSRCAHRGWAHKEQQRQSSCFAAAHFVAKPPRCVDGFAQSSWFVNA